MATALFSLGVQVLRRRPVCTTCLLLARNKIMSDTENKIPEPTDASKMFIVTQMASLDPKIGSLFTKKLLRELTEKGIKDFDHNMWEALRMADITIQMAFILSGLSGLLKSQEALAAGIQPNADTIAKIDTMLNEIKNKTEPKPDNNNNDEGFFFSA